MFLEKGDTMRKYAGIVMVILVLVAYGPVMVTLLSRLALTSPGFKVW